MTRAELIAELVRLNEALAAPDPPSRGVIAAWEHRRREIERQLRRA